MADETRESAQRRVELKRRRRELIAVAVAGVTLVAFVLAQTQLPPLTAHSSLISNLAVITLFNLSFLLLGLMLYLVGRNVAKVIFERRRGLIGSKFQVRLVFGFIAVAIVPSAFLLYVSGAFLHANVDSWFNPEYERVMNDSLEIAKTYYLNSANNAAHFARVLAAQVGARGLLAPDKRGDLKKYIEDRQQEYNLGTIEVFSANRTLLLLALTPKTPTGIGLAPDSPLIVQTMKGQALTRTDSFGSADIIRGSAPIFSGPDTDNVLGAVVVDYYLPKSLAGGAADISRTSEEYFQLRILKQPILNSYILALLLIGLVVVLLASWFGMYLARGITGPISSLAAGTEAIATGDLNYTIEPVGDDEIGHLVDSFNQMTAESARVAGGTGAPPPLHRNLAQERVGGRDGSESGRTHHRDQPVRGAPARSAQRRGERAQLPRGAEAGADPRARRSAVGFSGAAREQLVSQAGNRRRGGRADDHRVAARRRERGEPGRGAVLRGREPNRESGADGGVARGRPAHRA